MFSPSGSTYNYGWKNGMVLNNFGWNVRLCSNMVTLAVPFTYRLYTEISASMHVVFLNSSKPTQNRWLASFPVPVDEFCHHQHHKCTRKQGSVESSSMQTTHNLTVFFSVSFYASVSILNLTPTAQSLCTAPTKMEGNLFLHQCHSNTLEKERKWACTPGCPS